ncbi:hypothetical protein SLS62_010791 [Diatrype stigma]|uniref:Elongator complex protein 6 n=1 Tax=Diatrype stigma TaxID=117547 RepID=A0AAN9U8A8_9PEZI
MASRLPPLLEPYLRLPPETSLILLTGVLGSTTNWLVQRHLYSLLSATSAAAAAAPAGEHLGLLASTGDTTCSVVLLSFLRDYTFWKEGVGRLGVDLDAAARKGKLVYVDGLGALFEPSPPVRGPVSPSAPEPGPGPGKRVLSTPTVDGLRKELEAAVAQLRPKSGDGSKTVLIIDQLDLLPAAAGHGLSSQDLYEMLLDIRENVYSTIVTLSADDPLISSQTTRLEKEHAAFTLQMAHDAYLVMGLRMLDTGTAKDVSGVLRITSGGQYEEDPEHIVEEQELLYFVGSDGGVRVFERGQ